MRNEALAIFSQPKLADANPMIQGLISIYHITLTWGLIICLLYLAKLSESLSLAILIAILLGAVQHRFFTIYHEAFHGRLFSNRKLNEIAATYLASFPSLSTYHSARKRHIMHHSKTATKDDPERVSHIQDYKTFIKLIFPYFGLIKKVLSKLGWSMKEISTPGRRDETLKSDHVIGEIMKMIFVQLLLVVSLFYNFSEWAVLYYIGLIFISPLLANIRTWVEHYNGDQPEKSPEQVMIYPNLVERFFFAPMSFNLHAIHHANPTIPHFKLAQLAKNFSSELQAVELRRSGYLPVFWKYFIRGCTSLEKI